MGIVDRRRHQLGRLGAGIAEHDALVAGALFLVGAGLQRIDTLRDVGRLRMQQHIDLGLLPVEALLLIADVADGHARDVRDPVLGHRLRPARLARDDDLVGRGERLARGTNGPRINAGLGTLPIKKVDDLIGDAIAHFVRMTFGNGLAREEIRFSCHSGPRAFFELFRLKIAGVVSSFAHGVKARTVTEAAAPSRQHPLRPSGLTKARHFWR